MALSPLIRSKSWIKRSTLSLTLRLFPFVSSSSSFSSRCREQAAKSFSLAEKEPPAPKKVPFTVSAHGLAWEDPYHWMKNTEDPDFVEYLNQENSYAQAFMADTENLQRALVSEMKSRMPAKVSTPPERWGPWLYYQYIPEGKEYPVLCRRLAPEKSSWLKSLLYCAEGAREETLLDWNQIAEQYGYVHVGACRVSPDHNFLAYTIDITGSEQFMLQIKDLKGGCMVPRSPADGVVSLAWAGDGRTLFYTISDENQRPYRVCCTRVGSNDALDFPVFTESDSSFCVDITNTKDGKFITVYVIDATNPLADLQRIRKRVSNVQYFLEHHYGLFYILTNAPLSENKEQPGGGYYLARCHVEDIQTSNWQTIICPSEDTSLQDMDMFNEHLVLFLNKKGFPMLCSIDLPLSTDKHQMEIEDLNVWFFPLPSSPCSIVPGSNRDFMNPVYRVVLSSPVVPDAIIDYDMSRQTFSIVQQEDIRDVSADVASSSFAANAPYTCYMHCAQNKKDEDGVNFEFQRWKDFSHAYCCERKEVISHNCVRVPLTILYSKESWQRGQSPGLLQGYGAYGEVLDKGWCTERLSLLDRGWVVAFADVRGGGVGDSSWHKSGSGLSKSNSVFDFVSCANYLIDEGYIHRDRLGAIGYSAGCILVGAAMNMHPYLFHAAILKVPFLDVLNTLLDPSLPLTLLDYEEFGNPQMLTEFQSILSYSPYENIPRDVCHPSMLVTASLNDSRVGVWEAAKWVAKVRDSACSVCSHPVILKTNMSGGHFGEGGRYLQCEETAYDYAFLMKVMGVHSSKT